MLKHVGDGQNAFLHKSSARVFFTRVWRRMVAAFAALLVVIASPGVTSALTQREVFDLGIPYYNVATGGDACSSAAIGENKDYLGNQILTDAQIAAVEANRPFYEEAANQNGIAWQLLAALHFRETSLRRYGPANGQGPYQVLAAGFPVKDSYSDDEFRDATNKAAASIVNTYGKGQDLKEPDNVKRMFFAYNSGPGAPNNPDQVYQKQAVGLGFSTEQAANGEGSPYVMNRADDARDPVNGSGKTSGKWGQIKRDHGSIEYPANGDYGAYVIYAALGGEQGTVSCVVTSTSLDGEALAREFENDTNNGDYDGAFGRQCVDMFVWFIKKHTDLNSALCDGGQCAANLVKENTGAGISVSSEPSSPAVFSVAPGVKTWNGSGGPYGHVGIVIGVDQEAGTATTLETAQGIVPAKVFTHKLSDIPEGVTFVYLGDHLKGIN